MSYSLMSFKKKDLTIADEEVFTAFSIFYGGCNQSNLSS